MTDRPKVLIEDWLPVKALGIESRRERAVVMDLPPLVGLHVWWARRPLVASASAVLASLLPNWNRARTYADVADHQLDSEDEYRNWFHRLCGILGDPIAARSAMDTANARGERLQGNGYGYPQAYKNSPTTKDLQLLHNVLVGTWGTMPAVIDPTAGGGSIPFSSIRYGIPTSANDLNPVAAAVLRAGVQLPSRYGTELVNDVDRWGKVLVHRTQAKLAEYYRRDDPAEEVISYIHARTIACPRTGKPVPLSPNWWLRRDRGGAAVRLVTERNGRALDEPEFEIAEGSEIDFDPGDGTISRGTATSPWDGLAIESDYIKTEAQAGRMNSVLCAVATRANRKKGFRSVTATDLEALASAEERLHQVRSSWEANGIVPTEEIPAGLKTDEPHRYGIRHWADMFTSRQLLVHGTFVEEFRALVPEVRDAVGDRTKADAILALLGTMQAKALDYNSSLCTWHPARQQVGHVFQRHDFAFVWSFAEFDGANALFQWSLDRGVLRAIRGLTKLLRPADAESLSEVQLDYPVPASIRVFQGSASSLDEIPSGSHELVCIDPPYYDNVMYAELSDYFYVWEKRTLGLVWPEFFTGELTDKKNEAVANPARFKHAGRRRSVLATADYEAKMTAIFAEAKRVLRDNGVLTVMFTHKKAEAWDTLGTALMDAGFTIETSWPVPTETETSLHQAKKKETQSTIFLVCRKQLERDEAAVFFEDIEADVRRAARDALERFSGFGIDGVDLLLSTYGPVLSVISSHWPVLSNELDQITGDNRRLRPEEALDAAREELVRLQRNRLIGRAAKLDDLTDFSLLAWEIFKAREFPYDEARRLALAVGGLDVDALTRAKLATKKSGTVVLLEPKQRVRRRSEREQSLPGVRLDADHFEYMIDAVHTAMHITSQDGGATARDWLVQRSLAKDTRFLATVQGLVNAIPRTKTKGKWIVPEAQMLDELAVFLEGIDLPEVHDPTEIEQGGLDFDADASEEDGSE